MNYQEAIKFLQSFPDAERSINGAKAPTMSLASMKSLLARLGNPQTTARTIHITGSKGKGSTATLIASILHSAGYRTALYTSPHLHSYAERIAFDLQAISEVDFANGLTEIDQLIKDEASSGKGPLSTFGVLTALYFHLVKSRSPKVDWQIVEVGLGGTYDATNVFDHKDVAVITAISSEHTAILGNTVVEITRNKAGIITPGCVTVLAPQRDAIVRNIVQQICHEQQAEFIEVKPPIDSRQDACALGRQSFVAEVFGQHEELSIQLFGNHQIENAITAIAAVEALQRRGISVSASAIKTGLANATLPGRFEVFLYHSNKHVDQARTIILDGAHNQDSARALAETIESVFPQQKCIFILGTNQDKEIESIWQELKKHSKCLIATRSENPRALLPLEIMGRLAKTNPTLQAHPSTNIDDAFHKATSFSEGPDLICVTGSLYLVAEAREWLLSRA